MVGVLSNSMKHTASFDEWWDESQHYYSKWNITKEDFKTYPLANGFSKGDVIFLTDRGSENINIGDPIAYKSDAPYPVLHRVIEKKNKDGWVFHIKGDNYLANVKNYETDDINITEEQILGKAVFRPNFRH